ncbi:cyclic nucleotide-binding protein [Phytohabitans sp. ZYX-F-186]|uniref:Cyclic nucleotide-binding protein n=1 Tax=Phytohabitans maris TaxID=3071409 RepID=A0ABU0ZJG8_9ACTN|nr:cyclic nucleotide-binding protein [Phytohabitans sp. ZYX-F-186]
MTVVETRVSVWEALAGRAPGRPVGPADPGLWAAVVERLNPARARPVLRLGIEAVELVNVRDVPYVMLRSPDDRGGACYLRLSPEEWQLAQLMDGTRTVARLVADFARISGRLAPEQVTRVVADLAGNRMLAELPVDAFRPLDAVARRPWPLRVGRGLLAVARGRRMVLADVDPLVTFLYRAGGRALFTRAVGFVLAAVAALGLVLFGWTWWRGEQAVFLTGGSYAAGAAVLLALNVLALACHELGHALATKHAGRRVPAAGFLVYFGIPSIFVDTTDVWMAGRRARMLTTASGPAAGLILAGLAQIVGLLVPEAAPWAFKLAFAWYLNALFNLNPFLALDGYYFLMDWLEIANLRARGLAYVVARIRRRPPSWTQLDREGRIIALYGTLAVLWLVIAVNLGWRIWTDRVEGLITGLWRSGWPARLLLFAVVVGLAAPLVYLLAGWLGRLWRKARRRAAERRIASDLPRRVDALRASALGRLPLDRLTHLATHASWVHPRTGQQMVFAGAAQPAVYVVVEGAMEGRRPGDPAGTVRERLGPGGVIGLAAAVTGSPATLAWHTAGTTLLAVPPALVATAVGRLPGPPPADRAEAESLFADTPALDGLAAEEKIGLIAQARPTALEPGAPVVLPAAHAALVIATGVVVLPDGTELRRGTMIGPMGHPMDEPVAYARTHVRLWTIPAVSGLPLLLGASPAGAAAEPGPVVRGRAAPAAGVHPAADYPPLASPPGPPPPADEEVDRRFERRMWWLVLLFLLLAIGTGVANLIPGPAWAEMPGDKALLSAERGRVVATLDGRTVTLDAGDRLYVAEGSDIRVQSRSAGRLTFRGGAALVLCAETRTDVGPLWSTGRRQVQPHGTLTLDGGRMLADTASTSGAFAALALQIGSDTSQIVNDGPAWYSVTAGDAVVSDGKVDVNGTRQPVTNRSLTCGDGVVVRPPAGTPSDSPSPSESLIPEETPTPTPTPAPTTSPVEDDDPTTPDDPTDPGADPTTPGVPPTTPGRTLPPPTTPTTGPPSEPPPSSSPPPSTTPPPQDTTPPTVSVAADPRSVFCGSDETIRVTGSAKDNASEPGRISVRGSWTMGELSGQISLSGSGAEFSGSFVLPAEAGRQNASGVVITVTGTDEAKNSGSGETSVSCIIIG